MSRQQFNDGQEVVFEDWNKAQARAEQEIYDRVILELIQRAEDSFFDDSFLVSVASPTSVTVNAGSGFQTDATVASTEPQKRLMYLAGPLVVNLTAADVVNDRIDLIVAKNRRVVSETDTRKFKNATSGLISDELFDVANDWDAEVIPVDGTPAGSPSAPAVPAGYIKIAEVLVKAVVGVDAPGNITDSRSLMPIGAGTTIDSSAFVRLTASPALAIQQALSETDAFLKNGTLDDNTFVDSVTDPAAPTTAGDIILYNKGDLLFIRAFGGAVTPVGSGGGGGGAGAQWAGDALAEEEFGQEVKKYSQGGAQTETLYIRVPDGYLAGRQISAFLGAYSPSATNEWSMQVVTSLIRKGQDAMDSTANQETNNSGDITNDQANEYTEIGIDLTTALGQVNGFGVSAGDLLRLDLTRLAPGGTEDTADLRFIPSATEVKFG